jgi:hypothetical protein
MKPRFVSLLTGIGVVAALASVTAAVGSAGRGFTANVTNPWFPLRPGTTYVYTGVKDGQPSRDVMSVTHRTAVIDGARCVEVDDRLHLAGRLGERTTDWYTQDSRGNVWYYGEATAKLDARGHVTSTTGSWRAGVRGAKPGIFMPAYPRIAQSFQQEYLEGQAEDHFQVLGIAASRILLTKEWTPLEPGVVDHKLYVRGVGTVVEKTVRGGDEQLALVSFRRV